MKRINRTTFMGALSALGGTLLVAGSVAAQEPETPQPADTLPIYRLDPVTVEGRIDDLAGVAITASQGRIGIEDIRLRPMVREAELLETVPGMILTQHSGDGKGNQMFVRGFNLDHGTDFSTRIEGMPVNLPTHAHGQGYTDLNFIIPELIDYVEYKLGVYYADIGDFGSAGGAEFRLPSSLPRAFFRLAAGVNGFARLVGGGSKRVGPGDLLVGGEVKGYDGPWEVPQNLRKWSALGRYSWSSRSGDFSVLYMGYRNRWDASDQIPRRAIEAGVIDRFGQVDSTLGGESQRHSLSATWQHRGTGSTQRIGVYGIYYDLDLYSNFTYFLDNPVEGDQLNQADRRGVLGIELSHEQCSMAFGRTHLFRVGIQSRADFIDVALFNTEGRELVDTVRADDVTQWGSGLYVTAESQWASKFRTLLGLRGDFYLFDVASNLPANSGSRSDAIVTPKASLVFGPWGSTEFYVSGGLGFHSNDARGTTQSVDPVTGDPVAAVDPLVLSRGAEIGVRTSSVRGWRSTLTGWYLELDSELLFVGDAGTTEPTEKSRRLGVTWANFYRPIPQLSLDLDVSLTHSRYADVDPVQARIPGALENVVAAGIAWNAVERGFFGAVRLRHFGEYPLTEDNAVRAVPTTLLNVGVGYLFDEIRVTVEVINLLDAEDNDIQYFYASRGPTEPTDGVEDIHFHPVEPRQLRAAVSWGF